MIRKCRNCGDEISEEEYELYDGLCELCAWEEEEDDYMFFGE